MFNIRQRTCSLIIIGGILAAAALAPFAGLPFGHAAGRIVASAQPVASPTPVPPTATVVPMHTPLPTPTTIPLPGPSATPDLSSPYIENGVLYNFGAFTNVRNSSDFNNDVPPPGSVMGRMLSTVIVYQDPNTINPLFYAIQDRRVWVLGPDPSGQFYRIIYNHQRVWVLAAALSTDPDSPWNNAPLPTTLLSG